MKGIKQVWERLLKLSDVHQIVSKGECRGGGKMFAFTGLPIPNNFEYSCIAMQIKIWLAEHPEEAKGQLQKSKGGVGLTHLFVTKDKRK